MTSLPVGPDRSMKNARSMQRRNLDGIPNAPAIMRISHEFPNVAACSPVLRGTISARAGFENATVDLFGINPTLHAQTTNLVEQLVAGSFDDFRNNPNGLIIGSRLAESLQVAVGDSLQLLSPGGEYRRFAVAAIAQSGVGVVDAGRVYSTVRVAQTVLRTPYSASMIIYKLRDIERAPALARHFTRLFQHETLSWQEREQGNLQLFVTLRLSAAITVALIILLAGFGIYNVLTMSVLAKIKEIAILRSMGYRQNDISAIFLWQGAFIATAGSILGCAVGALLTKLVSRIPIHVRGLIVANHFLVAWRWQHYALAIFLAVIAVAIASFIPARRASRLLPVAVLRGSSV
jgi:lipoprotein-releasing system permease protein